MTPKFLTQASERMELPSIVEEKVIGEVCLEYVRQGEEEKSGVQVEYVEFEIFLRLSNGNVEQAVGNAGLGYGRIWAGDIVKDGI